MQFDIIQTDYLKNLKSFSPYFRIIAIVAMVFLILQFVIDDLFANHEIVKIIATVVIGIYGVVEFLNAILFSRIGVINFGSENIVINKKSKRSKFLVSNIQSVQISKVQSNHFLVDAKPSFEEIIELKENDLNKLKDYFSMNQIDYQYKSISNWAKRVFGKNHVVQ